jgi:hypothetical protein
MAGETNAHLSANEKLLDAIRYYTKLQSIKMVAGSWLYLVFFLIRLLFQIGFALYQLD